MAELKDAILDARYIEMISLADYIVRDCALPDVDADGNLVSGQQEIAAAIFRWAVSQQGQQGTAIPDSQQPGFAPAPQQPMQPPLQEQGMAPMDNTAPIPMNTGYMPDTQG